MDSASTLAGPTWKPSREAALNRLRAFVPNAGKYSKERNFDFGPDRRENVSELSPWIRRRIILEREVIDTVLEKFAPSTVEKFVQEVVWRTYWKGWLEMRPSVWAGYRAEVREQRARLERYGDLAERYETAVNGGTGIECFDTWTGELKETGYLHNHTRMWFASIWVHTLELPWALGADFFYQHLLDGDPASNTLGWKWVAGLQTANKIYTARASNISKFTAGQFSPEGQLNESPEPPPFPGHPKAAPLEDYRGEMRAAAEGERLLLLITGDDVSPHLDDFARLAVKAVAASPDHDAEESMSLSAQVCEFEAGCLRQGLEQAASHFEADALELDPGRWVDSVLETARSGDYDGIAVIQPPVGPWQETVSRLRETHAGQKDLPPLYRLRRDWDEQLYPLAQRGFFQFKSKVGPVLQALLQTDKEIRL